MNGKKAAVVIRCAAWVLPGVITCQITLGLGLSLRSPMVILGPLADFSQAFLSSATNCQKSLLFSLPAVVVFAVDGGLSATRQYDKHPPLHYLLLAYVPASVLWHYLGCLLAGAHC